MSDKFLTRWDLMERWGISKSQFERMKASGDMPRHLEVTKRIHRWKLEDVEQWEKDRAADNAS